MTDFSTPPLHDSHDTHQGPPNASYIGVIIVNYGTGKLIEDNLPALCRVITDLNASLSTVTITNTLPPQIVIVDNASPNGDAERLAHSIQEMKLERQVHLIAHPYNDGFGAGNNVGLHYFKSLSELPETILFLNPDATIEAEALGQMLATLQTNHRVGFVGCSITDAMGQLQRSAGRAFSPAGEFEVTVRTRPFSVLLENSIIAIPPDDETKCVDWVSGAVFLARMKTLQEIGGFDERFFLYFEETDLMRRAHKAGWETWICPQAIATHLEGQATGAKGGIDEGAPPSPHWFRSRNAYYAKHHSTFYHLCADAAWLSGTSLYLLRRLVSGQTTQAQRMALNCFLKHWRKTQALR